MSSTWLDLHRAILFICIQFCGGIWPKIDLRLFGIDGNSGSVTAGGRKIVTHCRIVTYIKMSITIKTFVVRYKYPS